MNMKGLLANFNETLKEYEEEEKRKSTLSPDDRVSDDLDSLIRERQETKRDTNLQGLLTSFHDHSRSDDVHDKSDSKIDNDRSNILEEKEKQTEIKIEPKSEINVEAKPVKQEDEITADQLEDDFADFDYEAPKLPKLLEDEPSSKQDSNPARESIKDTQQEINRSYYREPTMQSMFESNLVPKLTSTREREEQKAEDDQTAGPIAIQIDEPDDFDIDLEQEGRSRTINTVSLDYLRHSAGGVMAHNPDLQAFNDQYALKQMADSLLVVNQKPKISTNESRAIAAEIFSDITNSDDNEDDEFVPTKDPSFNLKSPKPRRTKGHKAFGSSIKRTLKRSKEQKEDSKLVSTFLFRPRKQFLEFSTDYKEELNSLKKSKGVLTLDVDLIKEFSEQHNNSEIRIRNLRSNFYNFIETNYGKITCIAADQTAEFVIVGTEKGTLVLWDKTLTEKYQVVHLSNTPGEFASAMFYDFSIDGLIVGTSKGDVYFFKLEKAERILKKRNHTKGFASSEILIVRAFKQMSHVIAIDSQNKIMYSRIDRTKNFQKLRITSTQVGVTKGGALPHMSAMPLNPSCALVAISAGTEIQIFEVKHITNPKPEEVSMNKIAIFEIDVRAPANKQAVTGTDNDQTACTDSQNSSRKVSVNQETSPGSVDRPISESQSSPEMEDSLNYSYLVFTGLKEEADKPNVLCIAHKKLIHIYELTFSNASPFPSINLLSQIKIQAPAIHFSAFAGGFMLLFDTNGDFYVVDEINSIKSSLSSVPNKQANIEARNKKLREYIERANACYQDSMHNDVHPTPEEQDFDKDNLFMVYDHWKNHLACYQTQDKQFVNYANMVQTLGNLGLTFVDKEGLYVFEIMDWKAYIEDCFSSQNYYMVLRVINDILDGDNDRLRRAPPPSQQREELAPFIRRVMTEVVPFIKIEAESDIERLNNYCMMILYKNGMIDYMLKDYEKLMVDNGIHDYYVRYLMFMFQSQLLPNLDMERIFFIIDFLDKKDKEDKRRFMLYLFTKKLYQDQLINHLTMGGDTNLLFYTSDKVDLASKAMYPLEYLRSKIFTQSATKEDQIANIYRMFWFICEHIAVKLERNEVLYRDPTWYITNWIFMSVDIAPFLKDFFLPYLEGLGMLLDLGFTNALIANAHLKLLEGVKLEPNQIMDEVKSIPEMIHLFNLIYQHIKEDPRKVNIFYLYIAILKFVKTPGIELNETHLKNLVFGLIKNINEIVEDLNGMVTHENVNIIIFATFTEHKEIFVDNQEMKELIMKNE